MTYQRLKILIFMGPVDKESMLAKMDVFLLAGRITEAQYAELADLMA